ncbi:XK-related protein 6-like [Pocillopora verrucosa]|uniref:XK-related protein 6-like n=1 Tax=Pocillopora verrucosa TaxID=203993 RepID=UPI003340C7B3
MEVKDLKWYSPFVFFAGAILSFADPITDILTLVEFYRADHKVWFGVGLTFVLLPCLAFPLAFHQLHISAPSLSPSNLARTALCTLHPFSAAFARLEAFLLSLKKCRSKDETDLYFSVKAEGVLSYIDFAVLIEAVFECAPQFIIQLYAISVQEEPVAIIQIISLLISFLTLTWAFTATDKMSLVENNIIQSSSYLNVKHQLALYGTHLLLLSSRLFAICYFTVSYKWWVIGVLMVHCCVMVIATVIQNRDKVNCDASHVLFTLLFMGIHSLRDDFTNITIGADKNRAIRIGYFSHILFVLENFFMILMSYFTYHPNAWYSLPVTVCVCVFSVLGSTMRICLLRCLSKRPAEQPNSCDDSSNVNTCV